MRNPWIIAVMLTITGCATPSVTAPTPAKHNAYAAIASSIRDELTAGRLTGISVALVQHGEILWEDGFGWADQAAGRKVTSHTAFSIASLTKSFTTTAMMTLVAAGKLGLDQPANRYLGDDKIIDDNGPAAAVTLRRLASHSSGLPVFFAMYPRGEGQPSVSELLRDYGHLVRPAGESYEYSNIGFATLGDIIARQSGEELGHYLQTHVLTPLGLRDSFFDTDTARRSEMAVRYENSGSAYPFYLTATPASGEMYASAHDLARYAMFQLKDKVADQRKILTDVQIDELHRPVIAAQPPAYLYALGWRLYRPAAAPEVIYHGGGQLGVAAKLALIPSHDAACVVLANRANARAFVDALCDRMLQTLVPDWHGIVNLPGPAPGPLAPRADYAGTWRGELVAQGRRVPVRLIIDGERQGQIAIGDGPAMPIKDLGLSDGVITGDSKGEIGSPDTRRNRVDVLALRLVLRGPILDGEIIAWDDNASLPHWVALRRQP
jgi:CubicO group peptidase (beta-lactamase class C family)